MKNLIRKFLPQEIINNFYHLPEAILANIIYGFPTRGLTVIGVTGTDGKTTTTNMIYQILKEVGKKVSMVSTINAMIAGKSYDTGFHVTSPDPFMVQKFAKQAKESGDQYLVLEVTSHSLDQNRFWGINFEVGVITNITHEHLDYHKTWENYFLAKSKLIENVKVAVLNIDEKHFNRLKNLVNKMNSVISFGSSSNANFNPKKYPLKLKIPGEYNLLNALAALAATTSLGIDQQVAKKTLENFAGLEGRMEEIKNNRGIKVIVDFAHTPYALESALKTLRKETNGKLVSVFGSAGQRDIEKRSLMGEVSAKLADTTIITAEDPRGQLEKINQQILSGAQKAGGILDKNLFIIGDREKAIGFAIHMAKKGDTVGMFGKGHEKSMNYDGKTEIPWSDLVAAKKVLNG